MNQRHTLASTESRAALAEITLRPPSEASQAHFTDPVWEDLPEDYFRSENFKEVVRLSHAKIGVGDELVTHYCALASKLIGRGSHREAVLPLLVALDLASRDSLSARRCLLQRLAVPRSGGGGVSTCYLDRHTTRRLAIVSR